jgi:hypothetical protein
MYVGLILGVAGGGSSPRAVSEVTLSIYEKSNYLCEWCLRLHSVRRKLFMRSQITLKFFHRWPRLKFRIYEFVYIYIHNLQYNSDVTELSISENYFGSGRGFSSP